MRAEHETHEQMLEAFKGERFVMNELVPPPRDEELARGVERVVTMAKVAAANPHGRGTLDRVREAADDGGPRSEVARAAPG